MEFMTNIKLMSCCKASITSKALGRFRYFFCKARRIDFISVSLLTPCIAISERLLQQDGFLTQQWRILDIDYFFSLTKRLKNTSINQYITCLESIFEISQ